MIPFDKELDANDIHILNQTECYKDDEESSGCESLNPENPEFYLPKKYNEVLTLATYL